MTRRFAEMGGTRRQNLRERVGPSGPVAPPNLAAILGSQLILDLNADIGVSGIGGSMVWADQSPKGNNHIQNTVANQPALVTNVMDGHSVLRGVVATRKFLARTGLFTGITPGDFPRVYVISSTTVNNANGAPFELGNGSNDAITVAANIGGTDYSLYGNGLGSGAGAFRTAAFLTYADSTPTAPALYDIQASLAGGCISSKNGVVKATQANGATFLADPLTSCVVVSRYNTNFDGDVFRIFIANPAPTAPQHTAIITYLRYTYPSLGL